MMILPERGRTCVLGVRGVLVLHGRVVVAAVVISAAEARKGASRVTTVRRRIALQAGRQARLLRC